MMYFDSSFCPTDEWLINNNIHRNNMVMMENYCTPQDRIQELWREITYYHLSYLEMEESPEKIEKRNKLEDYIREYLCMAPHYSKFSVPVTEEVLQRSANTKKDFSGYKAATGFNAIQLYAGNLISQPWRKEYRQIKTYCGFYKHQIEANLAGADLMFKAMGYKYDGNGILILEGPVCPDKVTAISQDCLIAYVECQILKAIWEEVSADFLKITWQEVLEFRKSHLCSPEQSVKALKYKQHHRQYQEHTRSYSQGSDPYTNNVRHQHVVIPNGPPGISANHSFPSLNNHHVVGLPPPEYMYTSGGCCASNYANYTPNIYMPYQVPAMKPALNMNGYFYNGMMPQQLPNCQYAVPTAQLIEVESHNGASHDVVDRGSHKPKYSHVNNDPYKSKNNNIHVDRESEKNGSQSEDWEYVYRNLESQGYSKDLGERGDILSPNSLRRAQESRKVKQSNLEDSMNNLTLSNKPLKMSEAMKKLEQERSKPPEIVKVDKQTSPSSSYENLAPEDKKQVPKANVVANIAKNRIPQKEFITSGSSTLDKNFQNPNKTKDERISKPKDMELKEPDKWACPACTFLNEVSKDICAICSKSRYQALEKPIEIGGAECRNCTLVNPKNAKVCQACSKSLEDSATYI